MHLSSILPKKLWLGTLASKLGAAIWLNEAFLVKSSFLTSWDDYLVAFLLLSSRSSNTACASISAHIHHLHSMATLSSK